MVIYGGNSGVTIATYLRTQELEYKVGIYHVLQRDKPVTLTYRLPGSPSYSSTNKAMPLTCSDSIETIVNRVKDEPSNKMHLVSVNFGVAIESASEFLSKMENDAELIKLCHDIQCGVNLPSEVPENIRAERLYFDWYVFWSKKHDSISSTFATSVLELLAIAKAENDTVFETRIKNNVVDWCACGYTLSTQLTPIQSQSIKTPSAIHFAEGEFLFTTIVSYLISSFFLPKQQPHQLLRPPQNSKRYLCRDYRQVRSRSWCRLFLPRCQDFGHIIAEHYYIIAIFGDIGQDNLAVHAELRTGHEYQLTVNRLVGVVDILLGLLIDELDVNILDAQFRIPEPDTLRLFHQRL